MMGLPRAPKSRPARPAVRLQPPKLKVKIKDIIYRWDDFEILESSSTNRTESGPSSKRQIINQIVSERFQIEIAICVGCKARILKDSDPDFDLSNRFVILTTRCFHTS